MELKANRDHLDEEKRKENGSRMNEERKTREV